MRKKLIAGNWKMHHTVAGCLGYLDKFLPAISSSTDVDILLAPSYTALYPVGQKLAGHRVKLCAQNLYFKDSGAFTGEISVAMLKECACEAVIVGHSERRHVFGETDELIQEKVNAGVTGGLQVIFCIGETGAEREAGQTSEVIHRQLEQGLSGISNDMCDQLTIAYEPVWAIGTGVNATPEQAEEVHSDIRQWMGSRFGEPVAGATRIIYGGSVKPGNSAELLSKVEIDGLLVGSASLDPDSFCAIIQNLQ